MKKFLFIAGLIAIAILSLKIATAAPAPKVTICHHTGSQTNPTVTITVSENAVDAHVKNHGDTIGACVVGDVPVDVPDEPQTPPNPPVTPPTVVEQPPILTQGK